LKIEVAVKMKCYVKYNDKMAKLLSLVRPSVLNGVDSNTTTAITLMAAKSPSVHRNTIHKKYYYDNIPNEFTNNKENGRPSRAQRWQATRSVVCIKECFSMYNDSINIKIQGRENH
jgi:hypothetical protein